MTRGKNQRYDYDKHSGVELDYWSHSASLSAYIYISHLALKTKFALRRHMRQ